MKIVITMAGMGSRFQKIGFKVPKHEIIANGKTLFEWSLLSLTDFFDEEFILIVRKGAYSQKFLDEKMSDLGIKKFQVVEVNELTDGQASTVLGADYLIDDAEGIVIYNIDTYIDEGAIKKEQITNHMHGFVPSFIAEGNKWSFVKCDENMKVSEVSEKVRISDYGTVGLYYFKHWSEFKKILSENKEEIIENYSEAYIAPMYKYLIESDKPVYASLIDSEELHVLGTPDDILEFDKDYLFKNISRHEYKQNLLSKMDFDGLDAYYESNLDEINILEYILYLIDTSRFERIIELKNEYDLSKYYESFTGDELKCKSVIEKYTERENYKGFVFGGIENQRVLELAVNDINSALAYLEKNQNKFFSTKPVALTPLVMTYVINKLSESDYDMTVILEQMLTRITVTQEELYTPLRKKYIFFKLFEYMSQKQPKLLEFPTHKMYNQVQKMHYLLNHFNMETYYTGIVEYTEKLYAYQNTSYKLPKKELDYSPKTKSSKPRIAVCFSGATRFNIEALFDEFNKKLIDPLEADVFITTWNERDEYPGFMSATGDGDWAHRYFAQFKAEQPRAINTLKEFSELLPLTAEKLKHPIRKTNSIDDFLKIFPNAKIKFLDQEQFEKNYDNKRFRRRGNLNMAKMLFGIWETQQLMMASDKEYDYVFRARNDWAPTHKITLADVVKIKDNEIADKRHPVVGTLDLLYYGTTNTMMKMAEMWKVAVENDDLSPLYVNGIKQDFDIHRMYDLWLKENNIMTNSALRPQYSPNYAIKYLQVPDFSKEIEQDLANAKLPNWKEYVNYFEKLLNIGSKEKRSITYSPFELTELRQELKLKSSENIFIQMKQDNDLRNRYLHLLDNDYIYYYNKDNIHRFIKRTELDKVWIKVKDGEIIRSSTGIYYAQSGCLENPKQILFIFNGVAVVESYTSSSISSRYIVTNFSTISKYIAEETLVIHIYDVNMHLGSFYRNTVNYPTYEKDVDSFLIAMISKHHIDKSNVCFYGVSKGASGSTYYGIRHNINFVVVDPILELVNADINRHKLLYLDNINPVVVDLTKEEIKEYTGNGTFVLSEKVRKNYDNVTSKFANFNFTFYNSKSTKIKSHGDIGPNTIPATLMFINQVLEEKNIVSNNNDQ
ncbi:MAG: XcbB/CpsF family capsular polysaccharide biosynthesis protein [Bacilli bacterium]